MFNSLTTGKLRPIHAASIAWGLLIVFIASTPAAAQRGGGYGRGMGWGRGPGGPRGFSAQHAEDRETFHYLLANHDKIERTVKRLPDGVETVTESSDPAVTAKIQEHVRAMKLRVEKMQPIHMRDPLFAAIFRRADKIKLEYKLTGRGVRVKETSDDALAVALIQAHADVVSAFAAKGFEEAMKNHRVPDQNEAASATATPDESTQPPAANDAKSS